MANVKQDTPAGPKMVNARCVMNYGSHRVGETITVPEQEYHRLRKTDGDGGFLFPVMISQADADALAAKKQAEQDKARAANIDLDRSTSEGWADYQRKAGEILAAQRIKEQKAQQAILVGEAQPADPEEAARKFREHVSAGRGV